LNSGTATFVGTTSLAAISNTGNISTNTLFAATGSFTNTSNTGTLGVTGVATFASNIYIFGAGFSTNAATWTSGTTHTLFGDSTTVGTKYIQWTYNNTPGTTIADGANMNIACPYVGINQSAPSAQLHVKTSGTPAYTGWDSNWMIVTSATNSGTPGYTPALGFGYSVANNTSYIASLQPFTAWRNLEIAGSNIYIMTTDGAAGNVGINTRSPAYKLDVAGTLGVSGTTTLGTTNTGSISNTGNISTNTLFASQGNFSSIISPQAYISSLIVDQFTIGFSTGYILMPDIVATTVSSGIINTGLLNAAIISSSAVYGKFYGDGSALTGITSGGGGMSVVPPFLSTTTLSTNLLTASNVSTNGISTNNLYVGTSAAINFGGGNVTSVGTYYASDRDITMTAVGYNMNLNATTTAKAITLTSPNINLIGSVGITSGNFYMNYNNINQASTINFGNGTSIWTSTGPTQIAIQGTGSGCYVGMYNGGGYFQIAGDAVYIGTNGYSVINLNDYTVVRGDITMESHNITNINVTRTAALSTNTISTNSISTNNLYVGANTAKFANGINVTGGEIQTQAGTIRIVGSSTLLDLWNYCSITQTSGNLVINSYSNISITSPSNINITSISTNTISTSTVYANQYHGDGSLLTGIAAGWTSTATSYLDMSNYPVSNISSINSSNINFFTGLTTTSNFTGFVNASSSFPISGTVITISNMSAYSWSYLSVVYLRYSGDSGWNIYTGSDSTPPGGIYTFTLPETISNAGYFEIEISDTNSAVLDRRYSNNYDTLYIANEYSNAAYIYDAGILTYSNILNGQINIHTSSVQQYLSLIPVPQPVIQFGSFGVTTPDEFTNSGHVDIPITDYANSNYCIYLTANSSNSYPNYNGVAISTNAFRVFFSNADTNVTNYFFWQTMGYYGPSAGPLSGSGSGIANST
jgi:hypothetical protein